MREYGKVLPSFWTGDTGRWIRSKGKDCIIVAVYLMTCPNASMIGLYYLPLVTLAHETGLTIEEARIALQTLSEAPSEDLQSPYVWGFAWFDEANSTVWIPQMAKYQTGPSLEPNDNRVKGIRKEAERWRKHPFFVGFHTLYNEIYHLGLPEPTKPLPSPYQAPTKPLPSQKQKQEHEQKQEQKHEQDPTKQVAQALPAMIAKPTQTPIEPVKQGSERVTQDEARLLLQRWHDESTDADGVRRLIVGPDPSKIDGRTLELFRLALERHRPTESDLSAMAKKIASGEEWGFKNATSVTLICQRPDREYKKDHFGDLLAAARVPPRKPNGAHSKVRASPSDPTPSPHAIAEETEAQKRRREAREKESQNAINAAK